MLQDIVRLHNFESRDLFERILSQMGCDRLHLLGAVSSRESDIGHFMPVVAILVIQGIKHLQRRCVPGFVVVRELAEDHGCVYSVLVPHEAAAQISAALLEPEYESVGFTSLFQQQYLLSDVLEPGEDHPHLSSVVGRYLIRHG